MKKKIWTITNTHKELLGFWGSIGITSGLTILLFGSTTNEKTDIIAGAILVFIGLIFAGFYHNKIIKASKN
jgi:hypothetical protein